MYTCFIQPLHEEDTVSTVLHVTLETSLTFADNNLTRSILYTLANVIAIKKNPSNLTLAIFGANPITGEIKQNGYMTDM